MSLKTAYPASCEAQISVEPIIKAAQDWADRTGGNYSEKLDAIMDRLESLTWVDEVCISHQSWITIDLGVGNPSITEKRIHRTRARLEKLRTQVEKG